MYRILTYIWLVAGVGLIIHDNFAGNAAWTIPGVGISVGWLCLLLAAYNFMRWWSRRMDIANRVPRRHYLRHPPPVRREPPDPNFIFTDEPYPPLEGEPTAESTPPTDPPAESRE